MSEFFKPWRRKFGVVTLVLACVFAAAWVRSFTINDFLATDGQHATYRLGSFGGMLSFIRDTPAADFGRFMHLDSFDEGEENKHELWARWASVYGDEVVWKWEWGQFHFGAGRIHQTGKAITTIEVSYTFPYWFFVVPLAVLSALLLITEPRKSKLK